MRFSVPPRLHEAMLHILMRINLQITQSQLLKAVIVFLFFFPLLCLAPRQPYLQFLRGGKWRKFYFLFIFVHGLQTSKVPISVEKVSLDYGKILVILIPKGIRPPTLGQHRILTSGSWSLKAAKTEAQACPAW